MSGRRPDARLAALCKPIDAHAVVPILSRPRGGNGAQISATTRFTPRQRRSAHLARALPRPLPFVGHAEEPPDRRRSSPAACRMRRAFGPRLSSVHTRRRCWTLAALTTSSSSPPHGIPYGAAAVGRAAETDDGEHAPAPRNWPTVRRGLSSSRIHRCGNRSGRTPFGTARETPRRGKPSVASASESGIAGSHRIDCREPSAPRDGADSCRARPREQHQCRPGGPPPAH